jgi:hypothetical protein
VGEGEYANPVSLHDRPRHLSRMNWSARTLEITLCLAVCMTSAGCGGEKASPNSEEVPSAADVPRPAPDADIAGSPFFLVTTAMLDPASAWLVSGNGEKTRLEGIVGNTPQLLAHDGKLWVSSQADDPQAPSYFWLQPVENGALGEAVPDFFPEIVALSFDSRYALSQGDYRPSQENAVNEGDGVRLYEWGASEPTVVFDGDTYISAFWSPTALEFLYSEQVSAETYDLHFVEVMQGAPSAPRRLVAGLSLQGRCSWSRDGRWVVCFDDDAEPSTPITVVAFDRAEDFASHEIELSPGTGPAISADGKYIFAWSSQGGPVLIATISGDERYVLEFPPQTAVSVHPTANWLGLARPDGTAELVTMDQGSPTRVSLGAGERVFFGESTERLWLADPAGLFGARILIRNGEQWETVHEVTDPGALTYVATDVAHAVISTEGGLQSLTVASGSRPEVLPVVAEAEIFFEYRGPDYLLFGENVSDDLARLHLVSWPEGAATVVSVDFEESNLRIQPARGLWIAGR